ncbi:phosphatidylserine decarboxylase proenzyme isoform 1 [Aphelenchoides avenae]|nr:phosphatidylserine decarboxylase proenzyme isoform 1 [Aphelenchus avenae]
MTAQGEVIHDIAGKLRNLLIIVIYHLLLIINGLYEKAVGLLTRLSIPYPLRGPVHRLYSWYFKVRIDEAANENLYAYPTLSAWFGRELKKEVRPISSTSLVAPVDGIVLRVGPMRGLKLAEVKGYEFDLRELTGRDDIDIDPANRLYQATVCLQPGNYHGIHSPTNWDVDEVIMHPGFVMTAKPPVLDWFPRLIKHDERAVLCGRWKHGFFSLTAAAALSVGDIVIQTVFEAPRQFKLELDEGEHIKYGQRVSDD